MPTKCYIPVPPEYYGEENYYVCNVKENKNYKEFCPYQDNNSMDKCVDYFKNKKGVKVSNYEIRKIRKEIRKEI